MPYTTAAAVIEVLGDDYDDALTFTPDDAILVADEMVTEICVPVGYTTQRLEMIERYLAAHFYQITKPRIVTEAYGQGDLQSTIQSKIDYGLALTHYGQSAMNLDTAGGLKAQNDKTTGKVPNLNTQKPSLTWLGKKLDTEGFERQAAE